MSKWYRVFYKDENSDFNGFHMYTEESVSNLRSLGWNIEEVKDLDNLELKIAIYQIINNYVDTYFLEEPNVKYLMDFITKDQNG